jgi:hypothetical protein
MTGIKEASNKLLARIQIKTKNNYFIRKSGLQNSGICKKAIESTNNR